jgi:hypothetical protein
LRSLFRDEFRKARILAQAVEIALELLECVAEVYLGLGSGLPDLWFP